MHPAVTTRDFAGLFPKVSLQPKGSTTQTLTDESSDKDLPASSREMLDNRIVCIYYRDPGGDDCGLLADTVGSRVDGKTAVVSKSLVLVSDAAQTASSQSNYTAGSDTLQGKISSLTTPVRCDVATSPHPRFESLQGKTRKEHLLSNTAEQEVDSSRVNTFVYPSLDSSPPQATCYDSPIQAVLDSPFAATEEETAALLEQGMTAAGKTDRFPVVPRLMLPSASSTDGLFCLGHSTGKPLSRVESRGDLKGGKCSTRGLISDPKAENNSRKESPPTSEPVVKPPATFILRPVSTSLGREARQLETPTKFSGLQSAPSLHYLPTIKADKETTAPRMDAFPSNQESPLPAVESVLSKLQRAVAERAALLQQHARESLTTIAGPNRSAMEPIVPVPEAIPPPPLPLLVVQDNRTTAQTHEDYFARPPGIAASGQSIHEPMDVDKSEDKPAEVDLFMRDCGVTEKELRDLGWRFMGDPVVAQELKPPAPWQLEFERPPILEMTQLILDTLGHESGKSVVVDWPLPPDNLKTASDAQKKRWFEVQCANSECNYGSPEELRETVARFRTKLGWLTPSPGASSLPRGLLAAPVAQNALAQPRRMPTQLKPQWPMMPSLIPTRVRAVSEVRRVTAVPNVQERLVGTKMHFGMAEIRRLPSRKPQLELRVGPQVATEPVSKAVSFVST